MRPTLSHFNLSSWNADSEHAAVCASQHCAAVAFVACWAWLHFKWWSNLSLKSKVWPNATAGCPVCSGHALWHRNTYWASAEKQILGSQGLCTLIPAPETSSVDAPRTEGFQLAVVHLGTKFHLNNSLGNLILYWFLSSASLCLTSLQNIVVLRLEGFWKGVPVIFVLQRDDIARPWDGFTTFWYKLIQQNGVRATDGFHLCSMSIKCYQIRTWQMLWRITLQTVACEQCKNALLLLC